MLWETETAKQLLKMNGRTNMAYKVRSAPTATASSPVAARAGTCALAVACVSLPAPSDKRFGLPSPDGRLLATYAPNSNAVTILETPSGRKLQTLAPPSGDVVVQRVELQSGWNACC